MPGQQMTPAQVNQLARALIKQRSVKMVQPLPSVTVNPANQNVVTPQLRNVGLILGFWVNVVHTISNGSGVQIDLTDFGPLNALQQIQYNDLTNFTRIQTPGWHVGLVDSVKQRRPFGTALVRTTGFDSPINFGSNFLGQISAPANIAAAGNGTVSMWYWVPLAYSDDDLRGCVYANVLQAVQQLILTIPQQAQAFVQNGTDSTLAMFVGHAAGSVAAAVISSTTINVFQVYYDQLPVDPNLGLVLPVTDLATVYELKQTVLAPFVAAQDNPYPYTNYRDFLSTFAVYVNTGASGARGVGADVNYWALQAANATNIWKKTDALIALETRNFFQTDMPPGVRYFGTRQKPISTNMYGNMQLVNNPVTAAAGNYQLVAVEDFALQQVLTAAGSLPAS